ncbi:1-hydroxycarotenoid 3,4-desaturase CrtD [Thetidibacter halocola]|uniref:1-hydroxycarotenoid 3,4-desaturase CrtD n=1 Tax=Thetidibacter halocola TaxID=2827239 RepID=UPI0031FF1444
MIGAGIGGLAAALPLAHAGLDVTVVDAAARPGGKMRQVDGVDAGPTVLTLRTVFDALFEGVGERLDDHVTLHRQAVLARHWWPDGSSVDLHADPALNAEAIETFAGHRARRQFEAFCARTETLFAAFRAPMMEAAEPDVAAMTRMVLAHPTLLRAMAPGRTMAGLLRASFEDPRLRQLFGRYATYVGGSPHRAPALLSLVWRAEAAGVWVPEGGMHALARAITGLIEARGAQFRMHSMVTRILTDSDGVSGVALRDGSVLPARTVIFNGDPRALALGKLGDAMRPAAPRAARAARSMSAHVWAFRARTTGLDLAHHNVFFCADAQADFRALEAGRLPADTTLYLCAEDRGHPTPPAHEERFEIILNAPPLTQRQPDDKEHATCHQRTFPTLARFGLTFDRLPGKAALTTPGGFETLFPGSAGSLYGQSPHGTFAALSRPRARTPVPGLYLAGGGCHPGAGVPMAALSGRHAAEAILTDRTSTSPSRRTAMRGGMSMRSRIAAPARSPSSGS